MKRKLTALLLALLMFSLTGCQLAREPSEQENANNALAQARFMGVYVVREDPLSFQDRTYWTEYGSYLANTEFGQLSFANEILIGQYDEATHEFTFPGLEGHALFAMALTEEGGAPYTTTICDMANSTFHVKATDAGTSYEMSGTLYYGPPIDDPDYDQWEDDRIWKHYHVYQMEDGTVFMDGIGDFVNGPGTTSITITHTATVNGEEMEYYTKAEVAVEYVERLTALTVRQYDGDGNLLESTELPIEGELPAVSWLPEAQWAVVEELRAGELKRTAYDRPAEGEEAVTHMVILLEDDGMGYVGVIEFE